MRRLGSCNSTRCRLSRAYSTRCLAMDREGLDLGSCCLQFSLEMHDLCLSVQPTHTLGAKLGSKQRHGPVKACIGARVRVGVCVALCARVCVSVGIRVNVRASTSTRVGVWLSIRACASTRVGVRISVRACASTRAGVRVQGAPRPILPVCLGQQLVVVCDVFLELVAVVRSVKERVWSNVNHTHRTVSVA